MPNVPPCSPPSHAAWQPTVLALVAKRTSGELTFPCGACLQVALELAGPELLVIAAEPDGEYAQATLGELLPRAPRRDTYAPIR